MTSYVRTANLIRHTTVSDIEHQISKAYDAHADELYRYAYLRVFSRTRAEDVIHDAFLRVWQYLQSGKHIDNIRAFLYKTTINLIIDQSRKKKELSLEALQAQSPLFDISDSGHEDIQRKAQVREITDALGQLPDGYRDVLVMRYINDLDPKDIAQATESNANAVSVKINRALNALREKL